MSQEDAVDWEQESQVQKIVDNFKMGIKEGELAKKLARYRELSTEIEALEASKDALRKELLELGKGEESIMAGGYAAFFKAVKGRESFDWKGWATEVAGKPTDKDKERWTTFGEPSTRIEVKRIGS